MVLTIELTPQEQRRVLAARARGLDIQAMIRGLIAGLPELSERALAPNPTSELEQETAEASREEPRLTVAGLETFLKEFAVAGEGKGYLSPEAFDLENLYEDRL